MSRWLSADAPELAEHDDLDLVWAAIEPIGDPALAGERRRMRELLDTRPDPLERHERPGHFTGVLTVVMKLLNIVRPDRAYFGEKDFQQYLLIRDMCEAFFMDVEIVPCETVREPDGLAMSSRNENLDEQGRATAGILNTLIRSGLDDGTVAEALTRAGFDVDYIVSREGRRFAAASVACGKRTVRLIDNVAIAA